jgi:uncharacterized protein (TIGR00255 family)
MIRSMTGFARREMETDWGSLCWELRSVNHRYLEVSLRLPEEVRPSEADFRKIIAGRLKRGKVDCGLRLRIGDEALPPIIINQRLLSQLGVAIDQVRADFADTAPVDPLDLLRWPRVIEEVERDSGPIQEAATALLVEALGDLVASREREGARLAELIGDRCRSVAGLVDDARSLLPTVREALRQKTLERVAQLDLQPDPERLEQELVLLAQKMDVDEELDRLVAHLDEVHRVLGSGGAVGRRLDFLMQEFNREANTLASKSMDTDSTRIAVELKVLIEQMREQVQNIE